MASKDQFKYHKDEQDFSFNGSTDPYSNLTLNKNHKCTTTFRSKNAEIGSRKISNSDVAEKTTSQQKSSISLKKFHKNLSKEYLNKNFNDDAKEGSEKFSSCNKSSSSTLSLHISAYENFAEAQDNEVTLSNKDLKKQDITISTSKQQLDGFSFNDQLEFPRQQENERSKPEVQQFAASQRLYSPIQQPFNPPPRPLGPQILGVMTEFDAFYSDLKSTEAQDAALTPSQQIERLLRPGATFLNLNPFEVLQVDPDTELEAIKKKYKKLSLLIHPDRNLDDSERAKRAFEIVKKAMETLEDPDEVARCREMYEEARARLAIVMSEKKRKLRKDGQSDKIPEDDPLGYKKALWATVTKVFADREKKRKMLEERTMEEKRKFAEEIQAAQEKRKLEEEFKKNYEETRDVRRGSWRDFVKKKTKRLEPFRGANFKPPASKLETSSAKKPKLDKKF